MAINNFKPFATAANANVTNQTDWETLPALLSGFTAGKASSAQVNKAIRQASFIAAALAQYTANKSGLDILDDGDLNGFITKMSSAFGKDYQALDATLTALAGLATGANKLPYFTDTDKAAQTDLTQVGRDIIGKNTIADILTYLRLGAFISSPSTEPGNFSQVNSPDGKSYLFIANNKNWGAQTEDGKAIPLSLERGGSGAGTPEGAREAFGLGNSATKNIGTTAGTVAAGDDSRLVNLKSAANRSVGNSANQIPDMSYFTTGETSAGRWAKLPSGLIIQAGFGLTGSAGTATVNLPIPFTGTFFVVGGSIEGNGPIFVSARGLTQSTIGVVAWGRDGSIQVTNMHWLAIGV
ncbi:gp53-like domain-containing protein [Citrobacter freundii]|uniref:gp53-like domain-containing protein n=1 Tax=Citrobacter freundii TaxID=546 RepID=UPI001F066274|nr:hypothetical protein [Citrobacter freundii]MDT7294449.1 hypothetical protein [Citrobacter freundii]MDT7416036.1 hypothetical protein [Citrobacter freundii]MEB0315803.1 hypothetical protein [Citrobacter freundii]UMB65814.1 hypothetical protein MJ253_06420 [Citrobacter freundii]